MSATSNWKNLIEAVGDANAAAEGYSNDEEISALRDALELALDMVGLSLDMASSPDDHCRKPQADMVDAVETTISGTVYRSPDGHVLIDTGETVIAVNGDGSTSESPLNFSTGWEA